MTISEDGQKSSQVLEKEAEAMERTDGDKIRRKNRRRTIEELREEARSYTHEFARPFTYNGNTVEKLTFQWDRLTGRDSISIDRELSASTGGQGVPNFGREHMALIAIRACLDRDANDMRMVDKGFMDALPIVDFEEITAMGRLFFRFWGLV